MGDPQGSFPDLADTIGAVRDQLSRAQREGADAGLRFQVGPVELEFEVVVSYVGGGEAGVRLYVVTLGAKGEVTSGSTHRVKVTLQPVDPVTGKDAEVADQTSRAGPPGGWAGSEPAGGAAP